MSATSTGISLLADPAFPRLKAEVIAATGLSYWADKEPELACALASVAVEAGLDAGDLGDRLAAEAGEGMLTDAVVRAVTVGETFFFRYREQFDALAATILPDRLRRRTGERGLSVWSAGCSDGAEAYSIAITIYRCCVSPLADWRVQVLGTDLSRAAIEAAWVGEYGAWAFRGLPERLRRECFTRAGNKWRIADVYRKGVEFRVHNLVAAPPPAAVTEDGLFDVVFCRNVLMYFSPSTRADVLARLHGALAEGGWLVVGPAEAGEDAARLFETVPQPGCTLYHKSRTVPPPAPPPGRPPSQTRPDAPPPPATSSGPGIPVRALLDHGDFERAAEAARAWVASAPLDAAAYYHLGLAVEPASAVEAVGAFRRAVSLDPGFSLARFHLLRLEAPAEADRQRRVLAADLAGRPDSEMLTQGDGLTAGELAAIVQRLPGRMPR